MMTIFANQIKLSLERRTVAKNIVNSTCSDINTICNIQSPVSENIQLSDIAIGFFFLESNIGLLGRESKTKSYTISNKGVPLMHLHCVTLIFPLFTCFYRFSFSFI